MLLSVVVHIEIGVDVVVGFGEIHAPRDICFFRTVGCINGVMVFHRYN